MVASLQWNNGDIMDDVFEAHMYSDNHMKQLMQDSVCGCFYCCRIFHPSEITEWIEDTSGTAVCPFCGVDSIIGESSGYPITEEFLERMRKRWF